MVPEIWSSTDRMFLPLWAISCPFKLPLPPPPFPPQTARKIKIWKNWKKTPGDIIILHNCAKNYDHMLLCSRIWCMTDVIIFHFGLFFALYPLFKKWKTKCLDISYFYTWAPKIMIRWCTVPEIWCTMDGRTDGKSDI